MYVPSSFQEEDRGTLFDLIDHHGFATMISVADGAPTISHVPLLLDRKTPGEERLLGHLARANPHCDVLARTESVLAIFHGPHAYVSPSWFETHPSVPTWNYAVVHVHGKVRLLDAASPEDDTRGTDRETTRTILDALVRKYESKRKDPWDGRLPEEHLARLLPAIVGFEILVDRFEGKFKLSQNRKAVDIEGTLAALEREGDAASSELGAFSRAHLARTKRQ